MEKIAQNKINELIQKLQKKKEFDIISDFAEPLATYVISQLIGITKRDYTYISKCLNLTWAIDFYFGSDILKLMENSAYDISNYTEKLIAGKKEVERNRFIDNLLNLEYQPIQEKNKLIPSFVAMIVLTGIETVVSAIGNAVFTLLKEKDRWKTLGNNLNLLPTTIDELLRYEPPIQFLGRILSSDTKIHGITYPKGQYIGLCLGAANRDESIFTNPNELLLNRKPNPHLSFGAGGHYCFGAKLAKVEMKLGLETLLKAFPNLCLSEQFSPSYKSYNVIKGFNNLMVKNN